MPRQALPGGSNQSTRGALAGAMKYLGHQKLRSSCANASDKVRRVCENPSFRLKLSIKDSPKAGESFTLDRLVDWFRAHGKEEQIRTSQDDGYGPEDFCIGGKEHGGNGQRQQNDRRHLCPLHGMAQPDNCERYSQSEH